MKVAVSATWIRATHPYGYRTGEWAMLWGVIHREDRNCYFVRFNNGETDLWPVNDLSDPYEFKQAERGWSMEDRDDG